MTANGEVPGAVLALDVGGTKLAAALVSPDGDVLASARVGSQGAADGEELWERLLALAVGVLDGAGLPATEVAGVGVGCGGPMRWPAGEVSPLNIAVWRDFPLRARLAEHWPGVAVRLHNDAVAVAAGEHWRGALAGASCALGMVVSTGVGGGLVLGGRLVDGASGNAGHIGHVVVDPAGPQCACGGRGCVEAIARGPALVAWALEQGWRPPAGGSSGGDLPGGGLPGGGLPGGAELAAAARGGDRVAVASFARAGHALGVGIASAAALLDLQRVAIGGGVSQAGGLLFDPLEAALRAHAWLGFTRAVTVGPAALGQRAGLVGAAALVLRGDRYWSGD